MPNVRRRVERLERFLAPEPASDPYDDMKRLALLSVSEEDLIVDGTRGSRGEGVHLRVRAGSAARGISLGG